MDCDTEKLKMCIVLKKTSFCLDLILLLSIVAIVGDYRFSFFSAMIMGFAFQGVDIS